MIRALVTKGYEAWETDVDTIQFALNTAYSRALGTTPFQALHGFPPNSNLAHALGTDIADAVRDDNAVADPQEFSAELIVRAARVADIAEKRRKKIHEYNAHRWASKAHGRTDFPVGSYVMLHQQPKDKTQLQWTGPFVSCVVQLTVLTHMSSLIFTTAKSKQKLWQTSTRSATVD